MRVTIFKRKIFARSNAATFTAAFIGVVLMVAACHHAPTAELEQARQSIIDAKSAKIEGECLDFLAQAQKHLAEAEKLAAEGKDDEALYEAQKARHLAKKAKRCRQQQLLYQNKRD